MRINGRDGAPMSGQPGLRQADSVSKNIQRQIANKQKELQNLSSNQDMDMETKGKKRQEIMQEINDLNNQLRQRQIEQRQEAANARKAQGTGASITDLIGGGGHGAKSGAQGAGLSQINMRAMVSADSAMAQAKVQGSVAKSMENRAGVLKAEIKQDTGRTDVEAKKKELAEVEQKMEGAAASQISTLSKASKEMEEARESAGNEGAGSKKAEKREEAKKVGSKKAGKREEAKKAEKGKEAKKAEKREEARKTGSKKAEEGKEAKKAGGGEEGKETPGQEQKEAERGQRHSSVDIYL